MNGQHLIAFAARQSDLSCSFALHSSPSHFFLSLSFNIEISLSRLFLCRIASVLSSSHFKLADVPTLKELYQKTNKQKSISEQIHQSVSLSASLQSGLSSTVLQSHLYSSAMPEPFLPMEVGFIVLRACDEGCW